MDSGFNYVSISSADANTVKVISNKPVLLGKIIILSTSAQVLTPYNNVTAVAADKIGDIKASVLEQAFEVELECPKGLCVNIPVGYTGSAVFAIIPR